MRGFVRQRTHEDEEESVFVTMTDMTISFLLIVMILLAFFATQLSSEDTVPREQYNEVRRERDEARGELHLLTLANAGLEARIRELEARVDVLSRNALEAYMADAAAQQRMILETLRSRLLARFSELDLSVSIHRDTLRFERVGWFDDDSDVLEATPLEIVREMGRILDEILKCRTLPGDSVFSDAADSLSSCPDTLALVDAVQIEGHTDNRGEDRRNFPLSAQRAYSTLDQMLRVALPLRDRLNWSRQPVLSIAGYGPLRPIATNDTPAGRAENRRIDLRIVMYSPSSIQQVEYIRGRMAELRSGGGPR